MLAVADDHRTMHCAFKREPRSEKPSSMTKAHARLQAVLDLHAIADLHVSEANGVGELPLKESILRAGRAAAIVDFVRPRPRSRLVLA